MKKQRDPNTVITARELSVLFGLEAEARNLAVAGLPKQNQDGETSGTHAVREYLTGRMNARHAALAAQAAAIENVLASFEGDKP